MSKNNTIARAKCRNKQNIGRAKNKQGGERSGARIMNFVFIGFQPHTSPQGIVKQHGEKHGEKYGGVCCHITLIKMRSGYGWI